MTDRRKASRGDVLDERTMSRLLDVARVLVSDLDLESLLRRLVEEARELTGARYAALGIVSEQRDLERFITSGIDDETHKAIGDLPRGRGILGLLIDEPRPIRLPDVGSHPRSYGFPPNHPPMSTFLGVPISIRGHVYGNLYLTEKEGGEFDERDQEAVVVLAEIAGVAIENARLYSRALERRETLERVVARLEATSEIGRAVGGETRLPHVLETVAKRGRALVNARSLLVLLERRGSLEVAVAAGEAAPRLGDMRLAVDGSAWRHVMNDREPERVAALDNRLGISLRQLGMDARYALLVPLIFRGRALGVLAAFDRNGETPEFDAEDEALLSGFASSAAMAVATAQSLAESKLRESIEAAERERARWARELHDETLQGLGAVRVMLASSLRSEDPEVAREAVRRAMQQVEGEIASLRALITELRPAALDELGLAPAIESLADNHQRLTGARVHVAVALGTAEDGGGRLDPELESAIYRVVQEALTNIAKHAGATHVWIDVREDADAISILVRDDGEGFDMDQRTDGFGLVSMRERVALVGGTLAIVSTPGTGTELRGRIPKERPEAAVQL
jgi:signal transduction histidine kinase